MTTKHGDLWEFSLALYAEPGVAASCLNLQNQYGFDINLVLFCIWYGLRHGNLTDDMLKHAIDLSKPWSETVIQPLRSLRSRLMLDRNGSAFSSGSEICALRELIKSAELDAERIQQQELERLILTSGTECLDFVRGDQPARSNLNRLAATRGTRRNATIAGYFDAILLKVDCPSKG